MQRLICTYVERTLGRRATGVYVLHTGIAVEIPEGYYGQIAGRSSLGKQGYVVLGGVVDSSYRGEVSVLLARMHEPASPTHAHLLCSSPETASPNSLSFLFRRWRLLR
jgi:predicted ABC-type transport system involved in lysophospholipase L1 biosynthesis ATPase subunit